MDIPNYDSRKKNNNFKRFFHCMPQDTFRMLICCNTCCGKTNLLVHMLMKPLSYHDKIHLNAKNLEQEKYQNMLNKFEKVVSKLVIMLFFQAMMVFFLSMT